MAIGDAYKLDLFQLYVGQRVMNSLAFDRKVDTPPTQAECQALAMDWKDTMKSNQVINLSHTSWRVTQLSGSGVTYPTGECKRVGGLQFEGLYTGLVVGMVSGDGMPPQTASVHTLKTGFTGRSRRGRIYLCGMGESWQTEGTIGPANITTLNSFWAAQNAKYIGTGTDPTWRLGVWSNTIATGCKPGAAHPHSPEQVNSPSPSTAFTPVISVKVQPIVYSQRKRTIGVGA